MKQICDKNLIDIIDVSKEHVPLFFIAKKDFKRIDHGTGWLFQASQQALNIHA